MKNTLIALMATAGAVMAETATFDFDVSDLLGKDNLTSVELIDGVTQFEATISGVNNAQLAGGDWSAENKSGAEYDFIKGAAKNASLTLTFSNLVAGSLYDITIVTGVPFEGAGSWNSITTQNAYTSSSLPLGQQNIAVRELTTYVVKGVTANDAGEIAFKINNTNGSHSASFNYASISGDVVVPEPTTATLSLLALAGLAARRRRR